MDKTILVLAPHTDDGELGCGGAMARFLREGNRVVCVAFSTCRQSLPEDKPSDILKTEFLSSMAAYGLDLENAIVLDYQVRRFQDNRQEILDDMIRLNREYRPDMVFMPSIQDVHQDHHTIAQEAMRAFKQTTLLGYEEPWNNYSFNNQCYIPLEAADVETKIAALSHYETQQHRNYMKPEFIRGLANVRGVQIGREYAEVFEIMRWVMK